MEGYRWVKNVVQRKRKGGKPAIFINIFISNIFVPKSYLSPKMLKQSGLYLPHKTPLLNPGLNVLLWPQSSTVVLRQGNQIFCTLLQNLTTSFVQNIDLKFIIVGDINRLNIAPILNLSPDLKQVVKVFKEEIQMHFLM